MSADALEDRLRDAGWLDADEAAELMAQLPTEDRRIMATFGDGSQVLVTLWSTGDIEVARREDVGATWGPPAKGVWA